jgi:putative ABC transport system permease protein
MPEPIDWPRSRERIVADNRAEVDAWIEERVAALAAQGMRLEDARRLALEEFGDVDRATRYAERQDVVANTRHRVGSWLEELAADVRIAARTLARTPMVAAVVLLTFALGIGATTAVYSVVHAMLLRPLAFGNESSLMWIAATDNGVIRPGASGARVSGAGVAALLDRTTSFTGLVSVSPGTFVFADGNHREQMFGASFTVGGFDVLEAYPAIGRAFTAADVDAQPQPVILLDDLWRGRFGADTGIVGRRIEIDGQRCEVIGVMPRGFRVPTYEAAELLTPAVNRRAMRSPVYVNAWQVRIVRVFGRLKPGVSREAAEVDVDRAMREVQTEFPRTHAGVEARLVPMRTALTGNAKPRLLILLAAAMLVLLIACANIAGILLARAMARRHELAVRVALGAGRKRLVRQFLAEGVVLATVGATLGLMFAQFGIGALRRIASASLPVGTTFTLEPSVLAFAIGVAVLAALSTSLVPALGATRVSSVALRDEPRVSDSRASRSLRLGLVAAQLAVAVVLLVGAGLFVRTLRGLAAVDLGYSTERIITFRPRFARPMSESEQDAYYTSLYAQVRAVPGVVSVGAGYVPTSGDVTLTPMQFEGVEVTDRRLDVRTTPASDDYFATLGIPVVRGRTFNADDHSRAPWVVVVSNGLAKQLRPGGDAIGMRIKPSAEKPWATIVGVVGDVLSRAADLPTPTVYTSLRQDHWNLSVSIEVRTAGDPDVLLPAMREAVRRVDPTLIMTGLRTLEDVRNSTPAIAERRLQMQLMLIFALIALVVSAIGVYGVNAYAMEARRREFGIRLALGASTHHVLRTALRDGVRVAATGAVLGVPLALLLAARLRDLLFGVAPFDPLTLGTVLGVLSVVVAVASLVPARRATLVDPVATMRAE